jgi:hypothetical protein
MPDRVIQILKLVCLVLAALVVFEIARTLPRMNILSGVAMPSLPTLASDSTNTAPAVSVGTNGVHGTNATKSTAAGTNKSGGVTGTNAVVAKSTNSAESNVVTAATVPNAETNAPAGTDKTNTVATEISNNVAVVTATNTATVTTANLIVTNSVTGTNDSNALAVAGTNLTAGAKMPHKGTNATASAMMRAGRGLGGRDAAPAELPVEVRARITRIYESEILGQVIRPMPMGLIGIAGDVAFLRSANGQTGLVKEGDSLGDLKLIQIGINRVLVESGGEKKELTIFDGYGSKSLLPAEKENPK